MIKKFFNLRHKGAAPYVIKLCSSLAIKYDNVVDEDVNEQQSFFKREAKYTQ